MAALTADVGSVFDPAPFIRREAGVNRLELAVAGARCAGCIKTIESSLAALPGMRQARMNLSTGKLSVEWEGAASLGGRILDTLALKGFPAKAFDPALIQRSEDQEARFLLRCLAVAGFASGNIMLFSVSIWAGGDMGVETRTLFHWLSAMIAIPAVAYAGRPFFRSALGALRRFRTNMDVPISLGVILAVGMSLFETVNHAQHAYFDAAVALLFFLLIGRYLDHLLRARARSAAQDLLSMQSASASRIAADGKTMRVAAKDIAAGDRLLVAPGERVVADGTLESREGLFDLALLTGETQGVAKAAGEAVQSGALNLGRPIVLKVTAAVSESYVAGLSRLLETAEQNRSQYVRIADRAARAYVPVVHGLALAALVWGFASGLEAHDAVMRAVTLLIITCPCALGLAVPAVQIVACGRLFRQGVLVKSGDALERLAKANVILADKTGTLTLGRPMLINASTVPAAVIERAARLARASRHPLARALAAHAGAGPVADDVREVPGEGLEAQMDGRSVRLGRAAFVGGPAGEEMVAEDGSRLYFREGEGQAVPLVFHDRLRADASQALAAFRARGLAVEILSGDRPGPVADAAALTGVERWRAGLLPEEKLAHLKALKAQGAQVFMIGDGINDAAALAEAHVSLSPGAGADIAQAAADMVLQGERLMPVVEALDVARGAAARIRENLAFSVLYNACAVPLAFLGLVTPLIAAIAMSGSSLIVTLNALRLAKARRS